MRRRQRTWMAKPDSQGRAMQRRMTMEAETPRCVAAFRSLQSLTSPGLYDVLSQSHRPSQGHKLNVYTIAWGKCCVSSTRAGLPKSVLNRTFI